MKPIAIPVLATLMLSTFATGAAAADIAWEKYLQLGANAAAIAAAVSMVDSCSKPLEIEEAVTESEIRLSFACNGTEDEEAAATIVFDRLGDDVIVPRGFELAG